MIFEIITKRMKKAITLILFLFSLFGIAQNEPNDCVNSITVCGNENFVSGVSGLGTVQEVAACGGSEHNSLWLKINIAQSGTLGFNLVPTNPAISVDYDFWIYGPNVNCTALGSPIRCCTTNPTEAALTSNVTGMVGTTLLTQSGPGADGNGFVRWLDVVVGQSYYIVIDRPAGDGGFEIQWTGSAMAGTGAFPIPPTANAISDYKVCSSVPNVGIFDLNTVRSSINSDLVDNEISFYETFANAFDGANELPNIISNTSNPQTIYAKVKNYTTDCYSITSFNLVVNSIPTATMSVSSTSLCNGESVTVSFLGIANSQIEYTINGGATQQALLDSAGTFSFNQTPTSNTVYQFLNIKSLDSSNNVICTNIYNTSINVSVLPLPTASISGTTTICSGNNATINFNGTPNAVVTYTINSGSNQTITLDSSGNASINLTALSSTVTYALVDVSYPTAPNCTTTLSGNAVITVVPILTASISGTTTICSGSSASIGFSGTPNAIVTFNNGSSNLIVNLNASGNGTYTTPALTSNATYTLVSVEMAGTPSCLQTISGSATISISSPPTASISGSTTICAGNTVVISFSGTPNATVSYTANSVSQTIPLDASGNATLTTPILNTTTTYSLVSASLSGTPICTQSIVGSAIVTVNPLPNVTISGTNSICNGTSATINFVGTPNAIVSYNINGGSTLTLTLNASGNFSITTPSLTSNSTYSLISVLSNATTPSCSRNVSGSAIITVVPIPIVNFTPTTQTICSGQSTSITLSSNVSTANYSWTVVQSGVTGATASNGSSISQVLSTTGNTTGTVTYTVTPTASGCIGASNTIIITVKPTPTVVATPTSESICSGGTTAINLSSSITGTTFSWTVVQNGVIGASNSTGNTINQTLTSTTTSSGTATYTITPLLNGCPGNTITVIITVSPMPVVTATPNSQILCTGENTNIALSSTNATTTYSWTVLQVGVSGASASSGNLISQTLTTTGIIAGTATYTITPTTNGCVGLPINVVITVNPKPTVIVPSSVSICTGETISIPLNSNLAGTSFTWTTTQNGVSGAVDSNGTTISQTLQTTGTAIGTVIYTITPTNNGCIGTPINYTVFVVPIPTATLTDGVVCVNSSGNPIQNYTFSTGLSNVTYDFEWYFQGNLIPTATQNSYTASQPGIYGVIIKHTTSGCESNLITANIISSIPGESLSINQSSLFSDNSFVEVIVNGGNGTYLYELDTNPSQTSNTFTNLSPGTHTVHVTDTNGCTNLSKTFTIINYPKFFTPNDDGTNDIWHISGLTSIYKAKVSIYDRFGKLIYSFKPPLLGWDGTYNGEKLFSTDYWFSVDYIENGQSKNFKAHFSLIR